MGRKPGKPNICAICGDKSKGVNFNAPTCTPCKAFFRRNALRGDKCFICPFTGNCKVNNVTRKFCPKCRLQKCFDAGMKKELILGEEERRIMKEKIAEKRLQKQQEQTNSRSSSISGPLSTSSSSYSATQYSSNSNYSPSSSSIDDILSQSISEIFSDSCTTKPNQTFSNQNESLLELLSNKEPNQSDNNLESLELTSTLDDYCDQLLLQQEEQQNNNETLDVNLDSFIMEPTSLRNFDESITLLELHQNGSVNQLVPLNSFIPSYNSILEFIPKIAPNSNQSFSSLFSSSPSNFELGFPIGQLMLPEKYLLLELKSACNVLHNPYKRIEYFDLFDMEYSGRTTEFIFYRLIRMCKQLSSFSALDRATQGLMLKASLLKLLQLRSVLMYNRDRDSWYFVDDNHQTTVVFRMSYIEPYCLKCGYQRHRALPGLFREEWKSDTIIFDLLTAIILFTPLPEYGHNYDRIQEEHFRYTRLLRRYLRIKYPTDQEADECFAKLLSNINEIAELNQDIMHFFRSNSRLFRHNPFFVELLDLNAISPTTESAINLNTTISTTNNNNYNSDSSFSSKTFDLDSNLDNISLDNITLWL